MSETEGSESKRAILAYFSSQGNVSGRTTRQVDNYVQDLFNAEAGAWVHVLDHSGQRIGDVGLFNRIRRRMEVEHHIILESKRPDDIFIRIPPSVLTEIKERPFKEMEHKHKIQNKLL